MRDDGKLPRLAWIAALAALLHVAGLIGTAVAAEPMIQALLHHPQHVAILRFALPGLDLGLAGLFAASARAVSSRRYRGDDLEAEMMAATNLVFGLFGTFVVIFDRSKGYLALPPRRGVPGRLRARLLGSIGALHFVLAAITWLLFLVSLTEIGRARLSSFLDPLDVLYVLDPDAAARLKVGVILSIATAIPLAVVLFGHWFLLPERFRKRFFHVFDVLVTGAFVWAVVELPVRPIEGEDATLWTAALRHGISAVFAIRVFFDVVPYGMDAFERINARTMIAARHLRSRRSSALAIITLFAILAVTVSTCLLSTVLSVMGGFRNDLERKILGNSAHVVVDLPHGTFEGWETTLRNVRATPGVVAASPYVQAEVMITSASNFSGALLRGIDPRTASSVNALERNLTSDRRRSRGSLALLVDPTRIDALSTRERCPGANREELLPPLDDAEPKPALDEDGEPEEALSGILIGSELARSLRLCVGDDLEVVSPLGELGPAGPIPKTRRFRVAGIFYSGMYEYDMKHVYVLLPIAQSFLRAGDALSGIDVRVGSVEQAPAAARRIRRGLGRGDLRIEDWRQRNQSLFGALALEKLVMFVTLGITVLIAGFCVFATLTLMVQEKRREVGILKAMGADQRAILGVFLSEGMLIGLVGALAGLGLGWLASFAAEHFGIRLNAEVYYIDRLPVRVDPLEFLVVGVSAVVVCVLSTIAPALYASRLRPVDAVRHD